MFRIIFGVFVATFLGIVSIGNGVMAQNQQEPARAPAERDVCGEWVGEWSMKSYGGPAQLTISCESSFSGTFTIEKTGKNRNKKQSWSIVGLIEGDTVTFEADWGVTTLTLTRAGHELHLEGGYRLTRNGEKGKYRFIKVAD